jgi:NitT/TauT family transport system ATP-binding protein
LSPTSTRQPYLTIRRLQKSFDGAVVYDDFDADFPLGKFISIFGPNGCGKSTFINMISGLMPMDRGEVLFDG